MHSFRDNGSKFFVSLIKGKAIRNTRLNDCDFSWRILLTIVLLIVGAKLGISIRPVLSEVLFLNLLSSALVSFDYDGRVESIIGIIARTGSNHVLIK